MPSLDTHRARTVVQCRHGHRHDLCVTIHRGVPPELRCSDDQPPGYVTNSAGPGCRLPDDLPERVERELQEDLQECRRRGYVLIAA